MYECYIFTPSKMGTFHFTIDVKTIICCERLWLTDMLFIDKFAKNHDNKFEGK